MEDREIVELFLQRREEAIEETSRKYQGYCFALSRRILADRQDIEEVFSDALLALWNSIPPEIPRILSAYLAKIIRNLSLKRYRDQSTQKRGGGEITLALEELEGCIPSGEDPAEKWKEKQLQECLNRFLKTLPEENRNVFLARYWHLYSVREITERTGYSASKVKMMLLRDREKLREHLRKEGYDESV